MASSFPSPQYARLSYDRRPKLLKDFLQDDPYSCSSNDFASYPRTLSQNVANLQYGPSRTRSNNKLASSQLLRRSRSSRAATATISAISKVINIVKFLPFTSVKSPSILPRSISRKLSRNRENKEQHTVTVKVKDILRWKSFRDLENISTPLDAPYSPYRCTTTIAKYSTSTSSTTTTSSKRTSWCDSDFTAEDLPSWCGENGELLEDEKMKKVGRKNIIGEGVGGYNMRTTRTIQGGPKEENEQQYSPVSVFESPFQEDNDEETALYYHRSLSNLEHDENREIEEKAVQLLSQLKETNFVEDDELLFNFFWHELSSGNGNVDGESERLMREAKCWVNGEYNEEFEWEMEDRREGYIRDMEKLVKWNNKYEEEKQELCLELEFQVLNDLVHEVLEDVFSSL